MSAITRSAALDHQRGRRRRGWLRAEPAPELLGAPRRRLRQPVDQLADLLVLEQPAHQLRSRVLPLVVPHAPRQQQLRLDAEQSGRHLKVVGRLIEPQLADHREELIGDFRDREIGDVELVLVDQVQQQVERARELLELDDEAGVLRGGWNSRHEAPAMTNPRTNKSPRSISRCAGHKKTPITPGKSQVTARIGMNPNM